MIKSYLCRQVDHCRALRNKLRSVCGMTLGETMVAMLIIALVSMSLVTAVAFGAREYNQAIALSETRILSSTLTTIISDELRNTTKVSTSGGFSYFSPRYAASSEALSSFGQNDKGQLVLICNGSETLLIGESAYSAGYQLHAKADVSYDEANNVFKVELTVSYPNKNISDGYHDEVTTFDVIPLNNIGTT